MLVDQFLQPQAQQALTVFQADILQTAEQRGLRPDNAVLFGSAALALHSIDARLPREKPSDIDAVNIPPSWQLHGLGRVVMGVVYRLTHRDETTTRASKKTPLELTMLRGFNADNLAFSLEYASHGELVDDRVTVGGLTTVPPERAALGKAFKGESDDTAALIKAHVVAVAKGHPVTDKQHWLLAISLCLAREIRYSSVSPNRDRPDWLAELIGNGFEHPAFTNDMLRRIIKAELDRRSKTKMVK
jgi:hypothetical protein